MLVVLTRSSMISSSYFLHACEQDSCLSTLVPLEGSYLDVCLMVTMSPYDKTGQDINVYVSTFFFHPYIFI